MKEEFYILLKEFCNEMLKFAAIGTNQHGFTIMRGLCGNFLIFIIAKESNEAKCDAIYAKLSDLFDSGFPFNNSYIGEYDSYQEEKARGELYSNAKRLAFLHEYANIDLERQDIYE